MNQEELLNKLKLDYYDEAEDIIKAFNTPKPITIRINTLKSNEQEIISYLNKNNITYKQIPAIPNSLVITNHTQIDITKTSIYVDGKIYLQSLSSQLPPIFLNPQKDETILDMTAAPGSKTTQIAALTNNEAPITALEKNKIRFERLKYNINHLNAKKVVIINQDSRNLDPYFIFDKILLDAPCSGIGTITDNNYSYLTKDFLTKVIKTQSDLLIEAIKHLKVNGELIYSTCSIFKEENEKQITKILNDNPNFVIEPLTLENYQDIPLINSIIPGTLTIKPTKYFEGFFIAKLKRIK